MRITSPLVGPGLFHDRCGMRLLALTLVAASCAGFAPRSFADSPDGQGQTASGKWFGSDKSSAGVGSLSEPTFDQALNASSANAVDELRLTPVREAALRDTAMTIGMQWGIGDMSRAVVAECEQRAGGLDQWYQFNAMMMGVGFLPPVISEAKNLISVEGRTMKVVNTLWRLDEEARPVVIPPTWRDWLYVGLQPDLRPSAPTAKSVLPRDAAEKAFYRQEMLKGYAVGKTQVTDIYNLNKSRLDRTYNGMRNFFDLWKSGRVTAPTLASATSIIVHEDPNTVIVGNTVFRITTPTTFVTNTDKWQPLSAGPNGPAK